MTKRLVCFDMDGVIFRERNFWMELHKAYGTLEQGKVLTEKYLHSDYDRLVEEVVVKLWKGKESKIYFDLVESVQYLPGVKETFDYVKSKELKTAIVSASSIDVVRRVQRDYGIDFIFGNELVIRDGVVSGDFKWPVGAGREKKADIIKGLCSKIGISSDDVIYVGDSDADVDAFREVGLSIAFNSNSVALKRVATHVVDSNDLSDVLKYFP